MFISAKAKAKELNIVLVTASAKENQNIGDSMQKAAQVALTKGAPMKTELKVLVVGDTGVGKSSAFPH